MNSMKEILTETNQSIQIFFSSLPDLETRWKQYLGIKPDQVEISDNQKSRLELTRMFQNQLENNKKLFHLVVTYKPYRDTIYNAKYTDTFFINFYIKSFLPEIMKTHKYHLAKHRQNQPICYAFLDEHESVPSLDHPEMQFSERLHHHAILAISPIHNEQIIKMCGKNKIPLKSRFTNKVMTTYLRDCDAMTTLYASKNLAKYPEFLSFPDRL